MASTTELSTDEVLEHLTKAEKRLKARHEWVEAFDDLLAAWRGLRASELAELCDSLSARAARGKRVGKPSDSQIDRVTIWTKMFQERSPLGLGVLLADLVEQVIHEHAQTRFLIPRFEALALVNDDPRVTSTIVTLLPKFGWGGQWSKALLRCQRALEAAADPRTAQMLKNSMGADRGQARLAAGLEKTKKKKKQKEIANEPPALPNELHTIVDSIREAIGAIPESTVIETPARAKPEGADPAALLEQVRKEPDDDALRLVLADALDAAGDPQGELIVLQIRRAGGESTAKTWARERQLLKTHMKTWLGAIAPVVKLKSAVFERGFLDRCTAVARRQVDAQVHFQHEEWATVRSITFENEARITPVMRSLREALNVGDHAIEQLAETGHPKLERLGLSAWRVGGFELLAACPKEKLPNLRHFCVTGYVTSAAQYDWIWESAWGKELTSFAVTTRTIAPFAGLLSVHANLNEVRLDSQAGFELVFQRAPDKPTRRIFKVRFPGENPFHPYGLSQIVIDLREVVRLSEAFDEIVVEAPVGKKSLESGYEKAIRDWLLMFRRPIQITVPFNLVTSA